MKSKFKNNAGTKSGKALSKLDSKDRSFLKTYGQLHPINEIDNEVNKKVQIVKDEDDEELDRKKNWTYSGKRSNRHEQTQEDVQEEKIDEEPIQEVIVPYQKLLNDLMIDSSINKQNIKRKLISEIESKKKASKKKMLTTKNDVLENSSNNSDNDEENEQASDDEEQEEEKEDSNEPINTYAQEVLCKDHLENEDLIQQDPFHIHFEKNLEENLITKLKKNYSDKQMLNQMQQKLKWPALGELIYTPLLDETKQTLDPTKPLDSFYIKQRILDRLNESVESILGKDHHLNEETDLIDNENQATGLNKRQKEILSIISKYVDFYHSNLSVKHDAETKFAYAIHALNHVLKTRSRIIAHNDKIKQNSDVEHRDQGLTRPKVLIIVPFRKCALKLVRIIISLIMRKSEEFVSNKKRFYDSFGPEGASRQDEEEEDDDTEKNDENKREKAEDFNLLFSGNVEDHFKIGLSVAKKSIKLYTEFYSSDIIIASPLGLKSVIGIEEDEKKDHDFLSSIELLIIDNADVLMMQNWEHVLSVFEHLHLQPKKSHDVDFSRVRNWLLDGHAHDYRQTLIFSRIPAPPINNIFNKYCRNFAGRCQINLMESTRFQIGTICKINFQLSQMFHRIECDSPVELPDARFNFFIEKVLPQFKDPMMTHTLLFIPSYFDFVKIRNYFKKNDLSFMNLSEYNDNKSTDRARYLFYHGRVHFMLVTERFHFYRRYRIRGINHIIFYDLPHYADFYSNFCNYLPDAKRKNTGLESFSCTVLYSKFDAQKLCAVVGKQRATHMINSEKSVHMFMIEDS